MNSIILYYTFGGSTKKEAEQLSLTLDAPAIRIKESKKRSLFSSFLPGGRQAMQRKAVAIDPLAIDLKGYDRILIGCPIWAGFPAPAFNSIVELLPTGKEVELFFCSGGGDSVKSEQGTKELVEKKGCSVLSYRDIKTSTPPRKMKK